MSATEVMTKAEFAKHVGRHPAFVTRAIEQGKLAGPALIGEGRGTRIIVDEAMRQLGKKLDLGQQLAQARPVLGALALEPAPAETGDGLADERVESLRLRNLKLRADIERGAREDAIAAGELVDAQAVSRALARQLAPLVNTFDELPAQIAKPIAEQFGLEYPEVLIAVKKAVRKTQTAWADRAAAVGRVSAARVAA